MGKETQLLLFIWWDRACTVTLAENIQKELAIVKKGLNTHLRWVLPVSLRHDVL